MDDYAELQNVHIFSPTSSMTLYHIQQALFQVFKAEPHASLQAIFVFPMYKTATKTAIPYLAAIANKIHVRQIEQENSTNQTSDVTVEKSTTAYLGDSNSFQREEVNKSNSRIEHESSFCL